MICAAFLVVVIALLVRLAADSDGGGASGLEGPLVSTVTGTTDRLTEGETQTAPTVAPAPGRIQPSQEQWEALLPQLQQIVAVNPDDVNAKRKLALAYYNLGLLDDAATTYEELLADKEDPVLRNRLGNTLRDNGDVAGAEASYREAIAGDPTLAPPYLNLAELLWRQGRDEEALAMIDAGLSKVTKDNRAKLEQGRQVLREAGN